MIPADVPLPDGTIVRVVDHGTGDELAGKLMAVVNLGTCVHLFRPPEAWKGYYRFPFVNVPLGGHIWITDDTTMRRLCEVVSEPKEKT